MSLEGSVEGLIVEDLCVGVIDHRGFLSTEG